MNLISFAYDFVSYILYYFNNKKIKKIYLFGSVVRNEADKKSDIDIFVDVEEEKQDEIDKIVDNFYKSAKYLKYWKQLNVKNQIKVICGDLEDFPDLKRSIISNGIVMYSNYEEKIIGKNYTMFITEFRGKFKDKVRLWRRLYGNSQIKNNKKYTTKGMIEENNGKKISRGVFVVPIEKSNEVIKELRNLKIKHKVYDICSDML